MFINLVMIMSSILGTVMICAADGTELANTYDSRESSTILVCFSVENQMLTYGFQHYFMRGRKTILNLLGIVNKIKAHKNLSLVSCYGQNPSNATS